MTQSQKSVLDALPTGPQRALIQTDSTVFLMVIILIHFDFIDW